MQYLPFGAVAAGLLATVSAASTFTQTVDIEAVVVCTDTAAGPSTVTETVTVTAPPLGITYAPTTRPIVQTSRGKVTSIDYNGSTTSVCVFPSGSPSGDATVAIYVDITLLQVIVVNIDTTVINGATTTITSTLDTAPTYTPPPPAPTSGLSATGTATVPPSAATTHNVQVGADGLFLYAPNQLTAAIGDIVRFDFLGKNHTVTQSNFATPCTSNGGFDTGFNQFNPTNQTGLFIRDFVVSTTSPLWFYCKQTVPVSHCAKGMVLGINPAGKFDSFLKLAEATVPTSGSAPNGTAPTNGTIPTTNGTATTLKTRSIRGRSSFARFA